MKLKVAHDDERITFISEDDSVYGFTEYTKKNWDIIGELNWYINDGDIKNGRRTYIYTGSAPFTRRYRKLYEVVMCSWYGKKIVDQMRDNKFIIEHLDNNPHNCSIENLAFAHEDLNKAKAFTFDKTRPKLLTEVAMNIYKNFSTKEFEITLGFNQLYTLTLEEDNKTKTIPLNALYLKYDDDFETVLTNANFIGNSVKKETSLNVNTLDCYDYRYEAANFLVAPKEKSLPPLVNYNNQWLLVLNEKTSLVAIGPSWKKNLI
ncbi:MULTISPECIES: hypothetical protein [Bacillus cereus group]|uniref:HNH endonuclease n=1 Tax=Bacillus thuringiensis TaxID=1428 RepID=A0A9X7FSL8_BACTU|nr:hypothetical protein [Bacillus thuringiensis]MCQ6336508.1 hypothetical protein [Bacillus cereus]PFT33346.1 hypothetical protein COK72_31895 [Bacillus thuringiensis]